MFTLGRKWPGWAGIMNKGSVEPSALSSPLGDSYIFYMVVTGFAFTGVLKLALTSL